MITIHKFSFILKIEVFYRKKKHIHNNTHISFIVHAILFNTIQLYSIKVTKLFYTSAKIQIVFRKIFMQPLFCFPGGPAELYRSR